MKKILSLESLEKQGLNTFAFFLPRNYNELRRLVQRLGEVTIRFDGKDFDSDCLPFYVCRASDNDSKLEAISREAVLKNCYLIVSSAIIHDPKIKFNLVACIGKDGSFIAEAGTEKVPLRQMYSYPTLVVTGNVDDCIRDWNCNRYYGIDLRLLRSVLQNLPVRDRWVECTYYREPVGLLKDNLVYWQVN